MGGNHVTKYNKWARKNRAYFRLRHHQRRAAGPCITPKEWHDLCERYDFRCLACGQQMDPDKLTIDHVVPVLYGGKNSIDNIQPLCRSCNSAKHTRTTDYRPKWEW